MSGRQGTVRILQFHEVATASGSTPSGNPPPPRGPEYFAHLMHPGTITQKRLMPQGKDAAWLADYLDVETWQAEAFLAGRVRTSIMTVDFARALSEATGMSPVSIMRLKSRHEEFCAEHNLSPLGIRR